MIAAVVRVLANILKSMHNGAVEDHRQGIQRSQDKGTG